MSNPLFNQFGNIPMGLNGLFQQLNQLKQTFKGDPMQYVQQMLNSGKITQTQYNQAVQKAQQIMRLIR